MIQRVQSIWLFLASLTLFLLLILPILTKQSNTGEFWIQVGGIYQRSNNIAHQVEAYTALFGLTILSSLVCLANIFMFRNRSLQKRIVLLGIFLILAVAGWASSYAMQIPGGIDGAKVNAGAYLPLLAMLFSILAFRGIRKDEQLIRSADRLR